MSFIRWENQKCYKTLFIMINPTGGNSSYCMVSCVYNVNNHIRQAASFYFRKIYTLFEVP